MEVKKALTLSAHIQFTRRPAGLTVAALLPYRPHWTPRPGGFAVAVSGSLPDGMYWTQVLQLVSRPCRFGGSRHYLLCPRCWHWSLALYWAKDRFACRRCAGLRYVSATLHDSWRLNSHYCELVEVRDHRPGRKPKRYDRYSLNAFMNEIRALHQFSRDIGRMGGWRR